jgi:hypothetical protein
MSPARTDSLTAGPGEAVVAGSVPERPVPGPGTPPPGRAPSPRAPGDAAPAANRRQVVLVAHVLEGPTPASAAATPELFRRAVVDVHQVSEAFGGETVAVLGNRVVAAFPYDQAAHAVDAAVEIQRDAARSATGRLHWSCSVSLVAGEVLDDPVFEDIGVPPVAPAVDRALLLSGRVPMGSVVVDEPTTTGAGADGDEDAAAGRSAWSLKPNALLLGHDDDTVTCYEILFDPHAEGGPARPRPPRPGARRRPARRSDGDRRARPRPEAPRPAPTLEALRRRPWAEGGVFCWFVDRGRGVITSANGQEFYVDRRFQVVAGELAAGDRVFFVPRDPVARGRNPVAGAVLTEGTRLEVRIDRAEPGEPALALLSDHNGTDQPLVVDVRAVGPVTAGDWLRVRVERGPDGPVGVPV